TTASSSISMAKWLLLVFGNVASALSHGAGSVSGSSATTIMDQPPGGTARASAAAAIQVARSLPTMTIRRAEDAKASVIAPSCCIDNATIRACLSQEVLVYGHALDSCGVLRIDISQMSGEFARRHPVRRWIVLSWDDILPKENRKPTRVEKHSLAVLGDNAALAEQLHPIGQRIRNLHRPAIVPERGVVTQRRVVVQDDEIPDALVLERHDPVEFRLAHRIEALVGEEVDEVTDGELDKMDARRFQWLEKARR